MEQRLYLAASRWAKANEEEEKYQAQGARKQRMPNNQQKYVQYLQRSQGVEEVRLQL